MDTKDCIFTRRSIRRYKKKDISDKKIANVIKYALYAPSSCNYQNWRFVVVRDRKMKEKLSKIHKYSSFVKDAPVIIIVCHDKTACSYLPSALLNVAAATENLLLGITNEGLGGCWVYVKDEEEPGIERKVKEYLNVPENIGVLCMVSVGYSNDKLLEKKVKDLEEVVHEEKW